MQVTAMGKVNETGMGMGMASTSSPAPGVKQHHQQERDEVGSRLGLASRYDSSALL